MNYYYENEGITSEYDKVIQEYSDAYNMPKSKGKCVANSHIFDDDKSVKWNLEEVVRYNQKIMAENGKIYITDDFRKAFKRKYNDENEECRTARYEALKEADAHIIEYLHGQASSISISAVAALYNYIYEKDYSYNYDISRVVDICEEILEIFSK